VVSEWARGRPKEEIYHVLQGLRSIAGYVATTEDLYRSQQLQERGFFQTIDHPIAGTALYPGPPFRIGAEPWVSGVAPLLGEHNRALYVDGLGYAGEELDQLRSKGVI
jgi:crotonobetainyl-CoA:carnitine CoA-transferase CaiB-like acyl-CoA transferase